MLEPPQTPPLPEPVQGRLAERVAIVTGSASGIGLGTARFLAREGAAVVIADLSRSGAEQAAHELVEAGHRALALEVDVSNEASVESMVARTMEEFGRLDVLHNNAAALGETSPGVDYDLLTLDVAVWDRAMAVNLRGVMLGCKHAIPAMLESGGGSIINTSSGASEAGHIAGAAYATSKAGVNSLTRQVATQFGKRGIRCNAVLPGLIMTPAVAASMGEAEIEMILEHHLTTHAGQPEDIAAMVAFLASDDARYVTGQLIRVDGGIGAHLPTFADTNRAIARAQHGKSDRP
jgi:NAD(P)-dependent dehydrogenase (short-subunit alcohol dehydrogenase family)